MNEEEIKKEDLKEMKEQVLTVGQHIKMRITDVKWWIDNLILIALGAIVIYYGIKGHYIDTHIIEVCNGQITAQIPTGFTP